MNITLEQQHKTACQALAMTHIASSLFGGIVCRKYSLNPVNGAVANLITEFVELGFLGLLRNPPLTFISRVAVRTMSVSIVSLAYAATRPEKKSLKAVVVGATAGSVCTIAIDLFKILISDDPTQTIAHQGYALSVHKFLEAARILRQSQLAVG